MHYTHMHYTHMHYTHIHVHTHTLHTHTCAPTRNTYTYIHTYTYTYTPPMCSTIPNTMFTHTHPTTQYPTSPAQQATPTWHRNPATKLTIAHDASVFKVAAVRHSILGMVTEGHVGFVAQAGDLVQVDGLATVAPPHLATPKSHQCSIKPYLKRNWGKEENKHLA